MKFLVEEYIYNDRDFWKRPHYIYYNDIEADFGRFEISGDWREPDTWKEDIQEVDYDYPVEIWEVTDFLESIPEVKEQLPDGSEEEMTAWWEEHFDELEEKYYNKIKEYFRDKATEEYNKQDLGTWEVDYESD